MNFHFSVTQIGSLPFSDVKGTCIWIAELFHEIPFWPQLVKRSIFEDMIIQFSEGIPFLRISEEKRAVFYIKEDYDEALSFYEDFLSEKTERFSISYDFAPSLYEMVEIVKDKKCSFIKGQSVGPVTFSVAIKDENGRSAASDPEMFDILKKAISAKAVWQIRKLKETGKRVILFFDEPYLSALGSPFSAITKEEAEGALKEVMEYVRKKEDAILGIHCCANTDWSMIFSIKPDIISFDAFGFMESFLIYKEDLLRFIQEGGTVAWGIVPTRDEEFENSDIEFLYSKIRSAFEKLKKWGADVKNSIITPSCGMGGMKEENAIKATQILLELSSRLRWER